MHTLIIIIHIIACFLMIGAILLQSGKGAEIGADFGGSHRTLFGSRRHANFLSRCTAVVAVVLMGALLSLAILQKGKTISPPVTDLKKEDPPQPAPTAPTD